MLPLNSLLHVVLILITGRGQVRGFTYVGVIYLVPGWRFARMDLAWYYLGGYPVSRFRVKPFIIVKSREESA